MDCPRCGNDCLPLPYPDGQGGTERLWRCQACDWIEGDDHEDHEDHEPEEHQTAFISLGPRGLRIEFPLCPLPTESPDD